MGRLLVPRQTSFALLASLIILGTALSGADGVPNQGDGIQVDIAGAKTLNGAVLVPSSGGSYVLISSGAPSAESLVFDVPSDEAAYTLLFRSRLRSGSSILFLSFSDGQSERTVELEKLTVDTDISPFQVEIPVVGGPRKLVIASDLRESPTMLEIASIHLQPGPPIPEPPGPGATKKQLFAAMNEALEGGYEVVANEVLRRLVAQRFPDLSADRVSDWEKVNFIRQWAYENSDLADSSATKLDEQSDVDASDRRAVALFGAYFEDRGGAFCGGTSKALSQLYQVFGYQSHVISMGFPGPDALTHTATLVDIMHGDRPLTVIQDAYVNLTYVDLNDGPIDLSELARRLATSEAPQIKILESRPALRDVLVEARWTGPELQHSSWMFKRETGSSEPAGLVEKGWKKFRTATTLEELLTWAPPLLDEVESRGRPREILQLLAFPFDISGSDPDRYADRLEELLSVKVTRNGRHVSP